MSDREFFLEVQKRYRSVPPQVLEDADVLELVAKPLRADIEAFETYRYVKAEPLACPIDAFGGATMRWCPTIASTRGVCTPATTSSWRCCPADTFSYRVREPAVGVDCGEISSTAAPIPAGMLLWRGPFLCAESRRGGLRRPRERVRGDSGSGQDSRRG